MSLRLRLIKNAPYLIPITPNFIIPPEVHTSSAKEVSKMESDI